MHNGAFSLLLFLNDQCENMLKKNSRGPKHYCLQNENKPHKVKNKNPNKPAIFQSSVLPFRS